MTGEIVKTFEEFKDALGRRESSNDYKVKNKWGYLGRWQFGMARLSDFGLTQRKDGATGWGNDAFEWLTPFSEEMFLDTPVLQNLVFIAHIASLKSQVEKYTSGLVAGAHLKGIGGLQNLLLHGNATKDALGTSILEYIEKFRGYEI